MPKDVDIILARDGERDAGSLSALGLSIPREGILVIALPLLLAIQLYFCVMLNALAATLRYGDKSLVGPWLGLYSGILAQVLRVATVLALPAGAALATILRSSRTSYTWQPGYRLGSAGRHFADWFVVDVIDPALCKRRERCRTYVSVHTPERGRTTRGKNG